MKIADLHNKKIAILWFWKEGQSSLRFLLQEGISDITVLDKNAVDIWNDIIKTIIWEGYLDDLDIYDIILKSPGVSPFQEKLLPYRDKFISQTQIFFSNYWWKVIGITGTKGKSTCSTLLYKIFFELSYNVKLVGNIGSPVLDEIDLSSEYDYIIYELSSYMLQDFSPQLTLWYLNNIYPCHLDWHYDSMTIYKEAKINILRNADIKIIHWDLAGERWIVQIKESKVFFDSKGNYTFAAEKFCIEGEVIYSWAVALQGDHNKANITWVIAILTEIWLSRDTIATWLNKVLPLFIGLPHRLENIGVYEGIRFINDAIATTPQSTIAAINTFDGELETLFIWWEDSGFDFSQLRNRILDSSIKNIVAFPDTSELIFPEIEIRDYEIAFELEIEGKLLSCIKTRHMQKGVDFAFKTTLPGKIAMLSCASPSFSLWKGYIQKAEEFISAVKKY